MFFLQKNALELDYSTANLVDTLFDRMIAHIKVNRRSTLIINASNFTNGRNNPRAFLPSGSIDSHYYNDGGSINSISPYSTIIINNSRFVKNHAFTQNGQLVSTASREGAVYSASEVTVDGCVFEGNSASRGGAVYSENTATTINTRFTQNSGPDDYHNYGGAIYSSSDIVAINSIFQSNWARNGGATYSTNGMISTSNVFINNTASNGNGGAIYSVQNVTAINDSFVQNSAIIGSGGAVYVDADNADIFFSGNRFSNNTAVMLWSSKCYCALRK